MEPADFDSDLIRRFYGGLLISHHFGGVSDFENYTYAGGKDIRLIWNSQILDGEQVLRIVVEDVSIPYKGD